MVWLHETTPTNTTQTLTTPLTNQCLLGKKKEGVPEAEANHVTNTTTHTYAHTTPYAITDRSTHARNHATTLACIKENTHRIKIQS